ncbi:PucR family transcriptional regulator [Mycobacterium sp. 48b]|uniref:PucR family transcriptional regulator n=1 Tax=Mycobacterium sp. 48b TaxID=3400426 RepID=UPI003AB0C098
MADATSGCTLGMVLAELGPSASLIGNNEMWLNSSVSAAVIWLASDAPPDGDNLLIVCPAPVTDTAILQPLLRSKQPRMVAVAAPANQAVSTFLAEKSRQHAIVVVENPRASADVIAAVARATQTADESISRRLASLQRTLSQALSDRSPIDSIMARLKRVCNATIVLIDRHGDALHATGPAPLSLLFSEIGKTASESQIIDVDGWHGVATRLVDSDSPDEHLGWLIATARRQPFPDPYAISAVHIAATLIEVNRRMTTVSRAQERAIRATVLEQALALRPSRDEPELAGRIAGLGITFGNPLRAVAIRPMRSVNRVKETDALERLAAAAGAALAAAGVAHLFTVRDHAVVLLVQADTAEICSLLADQPGLTGVHRGIGRAIAAVADAADSYHDAQLAVRTLRRTESQSAAMCYEDFDFATALFSDVGLDSMAKRAAGYLAPILERDSLVEGLQAYFDHGQNIIAAADELHIHHNSLRYRLSKFEAALEVNLKDAGDIASVFLALTALDLSGWLRTRRTKPARPGRGGPQAADIAVSGAPTDYPSGEPSLGVIMGDG